jgi:type IV pilus assembly protein PilQ
MNIKSFTKLFGIIIFGLIISGCSTQFQNKYNKPFKHNTPLIKENIKQNGKAEIQKTLELGPKPAKGKKVYGKRKKISSEAQRNYLLIPDSHF